jgi:hypothetical protein
MSASTYVQSLPQIVVLQREKKKSCSDYVLLKLLSSYTNTSANVLAWLSRNSVEH